MKNIIHVIVAAVFFTSCSPPLQILYTIPKTSEIKQKNNQYCYENDTLKLGYNFWEKDGIMSFTVENKLNTPLYIDWRKSALVLDKEKKEYWQETQTTVASTEYKTHGYSGSGTYYNGSGSSTGSYSASRGTADTKAVSVKEERISFIPPHSITTKYSYALMPKQYIKMDKIKPTQFTDKIKARVEDANADNSELVFSNFLTYSTKESFDNEYYITNEFYISKVVQLPYRYLEEMASPTRFYITIGQ